MRLGKRGDALRSLTMAFSERTVFVLYISVDPGYDELHPDSRFQDVVKRLNIPN
jgi:hypothetical protein